MEDVLLQIVKGATGNKNKELREISQNTHDFLESQQGQLRAPPHELRRQCFSALRVALDSKNNKLVTLSIAGLQKLLRDDRFHSQLECESESEWLPSQLLTTIGVISKYSEDVQVELMKVLLNLACSTCWRMNDVIILRILSMCEEGYNGSSSSIKTACQATASQTVRAFCFHLAEEDKDVKKNPYLSSLNAGLKNGDGISAYDDVLPIFKCFSKELQLKIRNHAKCGPVYFLLETLLSLVSSLPSAAMLSPQLQNYMWKEFCPDLLSLLGSPAVAEKNFNLKLSVEGLKSHSNRFNQLFTNEVRHLYSICVELVRLAGSISSLRPMLESIFHRILLYSSPSHRLEALRSTRELLKSPHLLMDFCGPLVDAELERKSCGSDLGLVKLVMDAFVECSRCNDVYVCCASVLCVVSMLSSLEQLCEGVGLNDIQIDTINRLIPSLESADYLGPMTYQRWEKLQKPLTEEIIENCEVVCDGENTCTPSDESKDWESDSSLSTEGPEENELEIDMFDDEEVPSEDVINTEQEEEVAKKRERIPTSLVGPYEENDIVRNEMYMQQERANAQHFSRVLEQRLSTLLNIRSSIALDEALQEFASKYCQEVMDNKSGEELIIVNADGIYLATYTSLLLNLKLIRDDFYESPNRKDPPINEEEFIETVHGSGVLVYLSATWLAELFQIVLSKDLLGSAGLKLETSENCCLVSLLDDLEGSSGVLTGAHLISDYSRLKRAVNHVQNSPSVEAGRKLARRVLTACWTDMVKVLSVLLTGENVIGAGVSLGSAFGVESSKEERRKVMEAIAACLDGLQKAAKLSNLLNLYWRCESVFYFLVSVSCPSSELSLTTNSISGGKSLQNLLGSVRMRSQKLHSAHVQSMDVILSRGLELGSYCPECWQHVFRCCLYLDELERSQFIQGATNNVYPAKKKMHTAGETKETIKEENYVRCDLNSSVSDVVKSETDSKEVLSASASLQVICILSQQADRLFDDAAYKLNLKSLLGFFRVLCSTSQTVLHSAVSRRSARDSGLCLVHRVGDTMLKCARSGRPLIHVMQCWSVVGLHLIEASCHPEQSIAKRAVAGIHDVVNVLLSTQPEMPHFHFNEALFKPFEKLLCLELCDVDIQDQILMSICEFVEGCTTEIKSGWRPLFGALKAVRPNPQANYYKCTALDVIEAFLNTKNVLVFCNAVVDCILCLLGHIKVSSESELSLCLPCLKYIEVTCSHLVAMHKRPSCPSFASATRVKLNDHIRFVERDLTLFKFYRFTPDEKTFEAPWRLKKCESQDFGSLEALEQPSGIIRVWFLIFEGLISAATQFPCAFHQQKLDALFNLIRKVFDQPPGVQFGLFVINHMLLPSVQDWLHYTSTQNCHNWEPAAISYFKQCCGQSAELVVDCLLKEEPGVNVKLMLEQLLFLMVECVAQPIETISKLGCSCIRHVILTAGPSLSAEYWPCVVDALYYCCYASLFSLRQLMVAFKSHSDNFYGDIGQVQVAARCDSFPGENKRLKLLAEQVFQLDNQLTCDEQQMKNLFDNEESDDDRSYLFLLNPPENNEKAIKEIVSVQLRSLVVGLVAHQMILQTIGHVLLQGTPRMVPALSNILVPRSPSTSTCDETISLPGSCKNMSEAELRLLLYCLEDSFDACMCFDSRPGLKFLVQKVSRIQGAAANLYRQMGASWTIRCICLLELHLHRLEGETNVEEGGRDSWVQQKLKETLHDMFSVYSDLMERKQEDQEWEQLQNQPIFFLIAHPDNFTFDSRDVSEASKAESATEKEVDDKEEMPSEEKEKGVEEFEKVYDVASQKDIDYVVNEYKKRKQHRSMPAFKSKDGASKINSAKEETKIPTVLKDREAQVKICSEMILSVFTYMSQNAQPWSLDELCPPKTEEISTCTRRDESFSTTEESVTAAESPVTIKIESMEMK